MTGVTKQTYQQQLRLTAKWILLTRHFAQLALDHEPPLTIDHLCVIRDLLQLADAELTRTLAQIPGGLAQADSQEQV